MKYMGSKRAMLQNGLGQLLNNYMPEANRFVDLFAGSGAVATFVARKFPIPVLAVDLQKYSIALSRAVIGREKKLDSGAIWKSWTELVPSHLPPKVPMPRKLSRTIVGDIREWCQAQGGPITRAYGGHYFSAEQSVYLDALRSLLPKGATGAASLAALIRAASKAVAAPGHTAQPFQPTRTAKRFLEEAWSRDLAVLSRQALDEVCAEHALTIGKARLSDANEIAKTLTEGDLVFIDPPYSGVHYSRFYHVLETVARGECGEVSGVGRYPATNLRPRSRYSMKTQSGPALDNLLETLSAQRITAILTFPHHDCSNGLSGSSVIEIATRHYDVDRKSVSSTFSTLGGPKASMDESGRGARKNAKELILLLKPKTRRKNATR